MAIKLIQGAVFLLLAVSVAAIAGIGRSEAAMPDSNDKATIEKMLMESAQAIKNNDYKWIDKYLADDVSYVGSDGRIWQKSVMIQIFKSGGHQFEHVSISDIVINVSGNTAVTTCKVSQKGTIRGEDATGTFTLTSVLKRNGNAWQVIASAESGFHR